MEQIVEDVEPFPLVPATWITFVFKCGLSNNDKRQVILFNPNFIPNLLRL